MSDRILIIDDDEQITEVLSLVLESDGYEADTCHDPDGLFRLLDQHAYSLLLLDIKLNGSDGLELLPKIRELLPEVPIFMITAHGNVDSAISAFENGATRFIKKPFQEGQLKHQIRNAVESYRLRDEIRSFQEQLRTDDVKALIQTRDPAMEPVLRKIATAARISSNVVIHGESGTGKELVARALHFTGARKSGPFVAFNCAAVPENLVESELFGYVRGAFTDARENKPGLFQRANGGTLFLDEIADASLATQAKLLRVIQEREVMPLGASAPQRVNVRFVTATHRNLSEEVALGRFRQDLYYRLCVFPIDIPALRDRPKDILLLAELFACRLSTEMGHAYDGLTDAAAEALLEYRWPGNVRELQNRIEHALAISASAKLTSRTLFPELLNSHEECPRHESIATESPSESDGGSIATEDVPSFSEAKNSFEKSYLERVLNLARGNIAKAARLASKSRTEVYGLLRKHGIDPRAFKGDGIEG